jgi:hypothetical protein
VLLDRTFGRDLIATEPVAKQAAAA